MQTVFGIWSLLCASVGVGCDDPQLATAAIAEPLTEAQDGSVLLTSGLVVSLHETRLEPVGAPTHGVRTVRLRYVSSQLEETAFSFERIEGDFIELCASFGLKTRAQSAPKAEQVIISIASQPTAFGESAPKVAQYFDAFLVEGDTCIWGGL